MSTSKEKLRNGPGRLVCAFYVIAGGILQPLVKILASIIPVNKKLLVFGSMHGNYYGDSSAHLFEWFIQNKPEFSVLWVTRSKQVKQELTSKGHPVSGRYQLKTWWSLIRARAIFFTNALNDCTPFPELIPDRCTVIYLTHDIAPKKTRHAAEKDTLTSGEIERSKLEKKHVTKYISTSPFITECRSRALDVAGQKFAVTGLPRTDELVRRRHDYSKQTLPPDNFQDSKIILYAPTWRSGREPTKLLPFKDLDPVKLSNILKENDALLLIRCHKNDLYFQEVRKRIEELTGISERILDASHTEINDINSVLPEVDVLVTDYSGILHDFLLLDRPVILVPYDLDVFESVNGFFYDYRKMAPGPFAFTFEAFKKSLEEAFKDPEKYADYRKTLRNKIFTYQDGKSCERVAQLIFE
jgi:CDP-glycerol glycerophosphotransferase (TagB/SpsB family)